MSSKKFSHHYHIKEITLVTGISLLTCRSAYFLCNFFRVLLISHCTSSFSLNIPAALVRVCINDKTSKWIFAFSKEITLHFSKKNILHGNTPYVFSVLAKMTSVIKYKNFNDCWINLSWYLDCWPSVLTLDFLSLFCFSVSFPVLLW